MVRAPGRDEGLGSRSTVLCGPSSLPVSTNRGRTEHREGSCWRAPSSPRRCILPRTPSRLFCTNPEIFMALRRVSLNEFFIKTLSGSQNTPLHHPKLQPKSRRYRARRYRAAEGVGPGPRAAAPGALGRAAPRRRVWRQGHGLGSPDGKARPCFVLPHIGPPWPCTVPS